MNSAFAIARKELRALFQSPIALIFLGLFLGFSLFNFFVTSKFFARNLADVRMLFQSLPVLLIFLVAAVTMRSWAEERRAGTLEVLLTLPVSVRDLVLGKFLAGMALVSLALLLTVSIPVSVSMLGPLDWGPVIGGYLGALLLASSYLAIGLCVSSRTDNQVVALMLTLVIGLGLYGLGTESLVSLWPWGTGEVLRMLGSGARFDSIERGVVDLRDIAYYGSITGFFLVLNLYFIEVSRIDPGSEHGRKRGQGLLVLAALAGLNAVAVNVWMAPVTSVRVDLTASGDYSISPTTKDILATLDEPISINGYFSAKTHPLLAPLVPQIRDTLKEYEVYGNGNVDVVFADPSVDEALEQEVGEAYGVRSFPFGMSDRHSQSVVNAFFHVVIQFGDEYEVLSFQDLIDVKMGDTEIDVKLGTSSTTSRVPSRRSVRTSRVSSPSSPSFRVRAR
jgi:ABC-2 type transport system permease protein